MNEYQWNSTGLIRLKQEKSGRIKLGWVSKGCPVFSSWRQDAAIQSARGLERGWQRRLNAATDNDQQEYGQQELVPFLRPCENCSPLGSMLSVDFFYARPRLRLTSIRYPANTRPQFTPCGEWSKQSFIWALYSKWAVSEKLTFEPPSGCPVIQEPACGCLNKSEYLNATLDSNEQ